MEFNDGYPEYETMALHDEEHGKKIRKVLWRVFWIMLTITLFELFVGFKSEGWGLSRIFLKLFFITFTVIKAGYIVLSFMHLGDEVKSMRYLILAPFIVFVLYLVFMVDIGEGSYSKEHRYVMDHNITSPHHEAATEQHAE